MKLTKAKIILFVLAVLLLACAAAAISEEKLEVRWRYFFPQGVSTATVGNVDGDSNIEVLVAVKNNTLQLYNAAGELKREVYLGSVDDYGFPYIMIVDDIDGDGVNETIVGFGGHRIVINHDWDEYFNQYNESVGRYDRVLSRSIRNMGSVRVYGGNFTVRWEYPTPLSVQDLAVFDSDGDGIKELAVALGGHVQDDWWEKGDDFPSGAENWTLVEYPYLNGSVLVLNSTGAWRWSYMFNSSLGDVRVRSIAAGYSSGKTNPIVVAGVEDGQYRVFNSTGWLILNYSLGSGTSNLNIARLESPNDNDILASGLDGSLTLVTVSNTTLWRSKFFGEITSTQITDIDADGVNDIFAGSRDGYLYVLNADGSQKWKYLFGDPLYSLDVADLDFNNLPEIITSSLGNVTLLQFRSQYFMRIQADGFFERAMKSYDAGDYMMARILLDKSENLYGQIGLTGVRKISDLRTLINRELTVDKKIRADYLYQKALEAYGLNSYNESLRLADESQILYSDLNDTAGVIKVKSLKNKIADEIQKTTLLRADSLYTQALSYFGFRNYTAAEENAKNARSMFKGVSQEEGIKKSNKLLLDVATARYDSAKQFFIGFEYKTALSEAVEAERIYSELDNTEGVNQTQQLISQIKFASAAKEPSFADKLKGVLPLVIFVLIGILLLSLYLKKRASSVDAEKIAESIEDEMGLLPPKKGGGLDRPF